MRYAREHKDEVRQRLLDGSARHVKQHGFAASGVDALAARAGVTSGSLYKHFAGKADLFAALIGAELRRTAEGFAAIEPGDVGAAEKALDAYLSPQHVQHPELGCPLPALAAEVARADDGVRAAFDTGLREVHAQMAAITGGSASAWALMAQSAGAVMLARAALDPTLQRELLDAARAQADALMQQRNAAPRQAAAPTPRRQV